MTHARRALLCTASSLLLACCVVAPAGARTAPFPHPVVGKLSVAGTVAAGKLPAVTLRVDENGVHMVYVQVGVSSIATHASVLVISLGWVPTRHVLNMAWPTGATLQPGSYRLMVSAHDHRGMALIRGPHTSGQASVIVSAPPRSAAPTEATTTSTPPSSPAQAPTPEAGVPTVAQTVAEGAVFPVAGAHSFGGPENAFGAPRSGYSHQGQDILTAEGTPIVAPLAGTILTSSYQEGGAGYYAVEHTSMGFDFMFAHCQAGSVAVATGQAVAAGQALCRAGETGDATTPHVDFEMWVDGWQAPGGRPIDPLAYLEAWEHDGAAG